MNEQSIFSESWYRIAGHRAALRSHVVVRRHYFRGERSHVLHDPLNNQFFRLSPAAYEFVARLRPERTVESVWHECMEANPEDAPGQEQVVRLLSQLHAGNLLMSDIPPDAAKVFERHRKRTAREVRGKWLNILFARFPLFDPDSVLKRMLPLLRVLFSIPGAVVWILIVGAGVKVAVDHGGEFVRHSADVLAPGNLLLLYAATVIAKIVHECGHAAACRRFGGEVHVMGVMLMIFTPLPYVDTTSSWAFRSRWARALVGAAGMIAELPLAAVAVFVWAATGDGIVHSLAFNVIFTASVSTLLFNLNPLLRFDGYYILSDLLEIPNLQARATRQLAYWVERYAFGMKHSTPVARSRREAIWLGVFGVAGTTYRMFVTGAILLFVAGQYLLLGLALATIGAIGWILTPVWRGMHYLAASPRLGRQRRRALLVSTGVCGGVAAVLFAVPASNHFRAPGVVEAVERSTVSTGVAGRLAELLVENGTAVEKGTPLFRLENPELALELSGAEAQAVEAKAVRERALAESIADIEPIDARINSIAQLVAQLRVQQAALVIRAPHGGVWHGPMLANFRNAWLPRGTDAGEVLDTAAFRFSAVVSQEDASRLFAPGTSTGEVRLHGNAGTVWNLTERQVIPAEKRELPSAALGWQGGGDVAISGRNSGLETREGFFEVRALFPPASVLTDGVSGAIRFDLPREPLGVQWVRKVRQLFQKRFGV